jgi:hypothetical protein
MSKSFKLYLSVLLYSSLSLSINASFWSDIKQDCFNELTDRIDITLDSENNELLYSCFPIKGNKDSVVKKNALHTLDYNCKWAGTWSGKWYGKGNPGEIVSFVITQDESEYSENSEYLKTCNVYLSTVTREYENINKLDSDEKDPIPFH